MEEIIDFNFTDNSQDPPKKDQPAKDNVRDIVPVGARKQHEQNSAEKSIIRKSSDLSQGSEGSSGSPRNKKQRIGDRLVEAGVITVEQLNVALTEKKTSPKMIGQILVDLGFITEAILTQFLADAGGYQVFDPKSTIFDGEALALLSASEAHKFRVLPIAIHDNEIDIAMVDPHDIVAMDSLRRVLPKGLTINPFICSITVLNDAIDAAYGYSSSLADILRDLEQEGSEADVAKMSEDVAYQHPIVRLVNALVSDAVKQGVSDLHFEPEENFVRLRYRLDGVLYTSQILHKKLWSGISQRIKIISSINIADKLSAQDGRFHLNVGGREADFRVSTLPTVWGENIVLRVLDKSAGIKPLEQLGFSPENLEKIKRAQTRPEGIIIVTGPTGSGKSTSLYSMINAINTVDVNIQTLEDPVEYSLPMIRQTNIREGVLDFADGIRALLRQDPDIIFVGEIRDQVTGEMAIKAAMTGHQVYTTLHTNDSFGAISRLVDLGLKPGMIAGTIIAVFAQRLVRRLCSGCKQEYTPDHKECEMMGIDPAAPPKIFKAKAGGCANCKGQGYKGRVAVVEILNFDEDLDEIVARGGTKIELRRAARAKGFKNMRDDGVLKVLDGLTSLEEVAGSIDMTKG
jgi:type IV pilus assembly protein PilB